MSVGEFLKVYIYKNNTISIYKLKNTVLFLFVEVLRSVPETFSRLISR